MLSFLEKSSFVDERIAGNGGETKKRSMHPLLPFFSLCGKVSNYVLESRE